MTFYSSLNEILPKLLCIVLIDKTHGLMKNWR